MTVVGLPLDGLKLVVPARHEDARGWFSEIYDRDALRREGILTSFVQDNQSYSRRAGTIRGLHFQVPPFAQHKLVLVLRGRILDVAVDLRRSSSTYGRHFCVELSAENRKQLLVPIGFAHGLITLEAAAEVFYKVSAPYSPAHDQGLRWNDPDLAIEWPIRIGDAVVSDRDQGLPALRDFVTPFP